jgi:predicted DNA-binding protein
MTESLLIKHDPVFNFQSITNAYYEANRKYPLSYNLRQIFTDLLNDVTEFYMCNDMLLVARVGHDEVNSKKILFIILAESIYADTIGVCLGHIIELAKSLDCKSIQWKSKKMHTMELGSEKIKSWIYEIEI